MKIIEKNEGKKINYNLTGTKLDFADGALTLDLARYQQDDPVTRTPEPLDTDDVTLYLFAIDGIMIH